MENERYMPAATDQSRSLAPPRSVARLVDNPQDDADEQMGMIIRDAAIAQDAATFLADRTRAMEEHFADEAMRGIARVARSAKAINKEFAADDDELDQMVRNANKYILGGVIDSSGRQRESLTELNGEIADQVKSLPSLRAKITRQKEIAAAARQPPVIVQAGPKLRPARMFENGKTKYVIEE